jgi:hypothetical protein
MSAQGFNATTYSGFTTQADKTGILPQFPLRNAGDWTRMLKRRSVYRELKTGDPFTGQPNPLYGTKQSNEVKLDYAFGRAQCGVCTTAFRVN